MSVDLQPKTVAPKAKSKPRRSAAIPRPVQVGWQRFWGMPPKFIVLVLGGLFAGGASLVVLSGLLSPSGQRQLYASDHDSLTARFASPGYDVIQQPGIAPLARAKGRESQQDALVSAAAEMVDFDRWLATETDFFMADMLQFEVSRLRDAAAKEAGEIGRADPDGQPVPIVPDPIGAINQDQCLRALQAQHCILLRYASEGVQRMEQARIDEAPYDWLNAFVRFRAALLAIGDPQFSQPNAQPLVSGYTSYIRSLHSMLQLSPDAKRYQEFLELQAPMGNQSPAESLQRTVETAPKTDPAAAVVGGE